MRKILFVALAIMACVSVKAQNTDLKNEIGIYYGFGSASNIVSTYGEAFNVDSQTSFWGPIGLEYFHHVTPLIGVGGVASIAGCKYDHGYGSDVTLRSTYYTVMPAVKFDWLRREHFGLYSELAAGVIIMSNTSSGKPAKNETLEDETTTNFMWQATAIGVEFGSAFRGFCELGIGEKGIFCAGLKYKF